jgi:alpha-L-fucosidase 2
MMVAVIAQPANILWYKQPADKFEESMVLGNGKIGASVLGGVATDTIFLNDITLWKGGPVNPYVKPEAYKDLPAVREALKNDNYKLADQLNKKLQGPFSSAYSPLGTCYLNFNQKGDPVNYIRELNIGNAIAKVSYELEGVKYTREYFISYPDQLMMIRIRADKKGALNFNITFNSALTHTVSAVSNMLKAKGNAEGKQGLPGTGFTALFKIKNADGKLSHSDTAISLANATEAIIYVSIATSFNGYNHDPYKDGLDDTKLAAGILSKAETKKYEGIRKAHIQDYQQYFNRVSIQLGKKTPVPDLPTDERLLRYTNGEDDKNLEALYFQFGRYLLISCSRTKYVPANLQGLWNPFLNPPWGSNYTTNINTEENYWLAENTHLSEMHEPLLTFLENLSKTGAITAKTFYGVNGWSASHNSDIWAMTNPVGDGKGSPQWANWTMAGTWLSSHLWEHYLYTLDKKFLAAKGYPLLKGAATFCLEFLVEDKNGYLITSPSVSPENKYIAGDGYKGYTLYGATADLALIRECFKNTIQAAEVLKTDTAFSAKLKLALSRLYPYQIGKKGNLQEWYYDWEDGEVSHQAQSHLFGLYPGHTITPEQTPAEAKAAGVSLDMRGDQTTGWSKAWRMNCWARLYDGEHAYRLFHSLLKYVKPANTLKANYRNGGTFPSLLDAHPPFQIDGNFGGTAGIVEMLMQSDLHQIRLLPALPDVWADGYVKGLCARGGFEVSMRWENKQVQSLHIASKNGGRTRIVYGNKQKDIVLGKGEGRDIIL